MLQLLTGFGGARPQDKDTMAAATTTARRRSDRRSAGPNGAGVSRGASSSTEPSSSAPPSNTSAFVGTSNGVSRQSDVAPLPAHAKPLPGGVMVRNFEDIDDDVSVSSGGGAAVVEEGGFGREEADGVVDFSAVIDAMDYDDPPPRRKPRKTFNEESEGDFIFTREPSKLTSTSGTTSSNPSSDPVTNSTLLRSALPRPMADATASRKVGGTTFVRRPETSETPIIRRNQAMRARADAVPPPSFSRSGIGKGLPSDLKGKEKGKEKGKVGGGERTGSLSLELKTARRTSSLRDGSAAYPHPTIPTSDFYRHISTDLPPVVRMRHLFDWALRRRCEQEEQRQRTRLPSSSSSSSGAAGKVGMETEALQKMVKVLQERVMKDLNDGKIGISWMSRDRSPSSARTAAFKPHPRNVTNASIAARLEATVARMSSECRGWEEERERLAAFERETEELILEEERLERLEIEGGGATEEESEIEAWEGWEEALDQDGQKALEWVRKVDGWEKGWARRSSPGSVSGANGKNQSEGKAAGMEEGALKEAYEGTELDGRWKDIEFNVDLLRARLHTLSSFSTLSSTYLSAISARATQTLRSRISSGRRLGPTSPSAAAAAGALGEVFAGAGGAGTGPGGSDMEEGEGEGAVVELLRGLRRPRPGVGASGASSRSQSKKRRRTVIGKGEGEGGAEERRETDEEEEEEEGEEGMEGEVSIEEADAMDLLRALGRAADVDSGGAVLGGTPHYNP